MAKTLKDFDTEFDAFFQPMSKRKEYNPEHDNWKREIRKKYATNKEIREHKRSWQE